MTTPPKRSDDERPAEDAHTPAHSTNSGTQKPASIAFRLRRPLVFLFIFAALFLFHLSLLNLPYYWDEAGYFIPAARDIYADGSFIPHSTLSNAHPPLVMAYLAIAWKLFGFRIEVARTAMLLVSAFALTGLFRLAERVANTRVAAATVVCAALYPVFFAQSSLAHLDMMVAALTMWGLFLYLPPTASRKIESGSIESDSTATRNEVGAGAGVFERRGVRRALCVAVFALAALAKETAALVPVALFGWEILCWAAGRNERLAALVCVERRRPLSSLVLLVALVPLASWFAYHRAHGLHVRQPGILPLQRRLDARPHARGRNSPPPLRPGHDLHESLGAHARRNRRDVAEAAARRRRRAPAHRRTRATPLRGARLRARRRALVRRRRGARALPPAGAAARRARVGLYALASCPALAARRRARLRRVRLSHGGQPARRVPLGREPRLPRLHTPAPRRRALPRNQLPASARADDLARDRRAEEPLLRLPHAPAPSLPRRGLQTRISHQGRRAQVRLRRRAPLLDARRPHARRGASDARRARRLPRGAQRPVGRRRGFRKRGLTCLGHDSD